MADNFTIRDFFNGAQKKIRSSASTSDPTADRVHHKIEEHTIVDPAQMLRGTATTTDTNDHILLAIPVDTADAANRLYVTGVQVRNSGSTGALITLKDGNAGATLAYLYVPASGGKDDGEYFPVPLVCSVETDLYFAADHSSSTIYASAQGYKAP